MADKIVTPLTQEQFNEKYGSLNLRPPEVQTFALGKQGEVCKRWDVCVDQKRPVYLWNATGGCTDPAEEDC